jgi:hypothetical protein
MLPPPLLEVGGMSCKDAASVYLFLQPNINLCCIVGSPAHLISDSNGFRTVSTKNKTIFGGPAVPVVRHLHQPFIDVQNSASLLITLKTETSEALSISRSIPEINTNNVEESL